MTTTRCYCRKYCSTERVSVKKFDCVQLGILRNQFGKKRYYLVLGMGPNVGPKWRAAAIFFPSHDKNVSSGGILSARRCLRTRIFFYMALYINNNSSSLMLLDHCYALGLLLLHSDPLEEKGPIDIFLRHTGITPRRMWQKRLNACAGP